MKYIAKRKGHVECLGDENNAPPSTSEEADRRWNRFSGSRDYRLLVDILDDEQYGLCAYTELKLDDDAVGGHVEHVKPKSKYPQNTFDYRNLVLSALDSNKLSSLKTQYPKASKTSFGGHAKLSSYDKNQFFSPLNARSKRNYFLYQSDGKVVPNPLMTKRYQKRVRYTIRLLNLNHPMLVTRRKQWIEELDELMDQHLTDDMCLESLAKVDLEPTAGKLSNFFTATCQRFGPALTTPIISRYYRA